MILLQIFCLMNIFMVKVSTATLSAFQLNDKTDGSSRAKHLSNVATLLEVQKNKQFMFMKEIFFMESIFADKLENLCQRVDKRTNSFVQRNQINRSGIDRRHKSVCGLIVHMQHTCYSYNGVETSIQTTLTYQEVKRGDETYSYDRNRHRNHSP